MIVVRLINRGALAVTVASMLVAAAGPASAYASSPWWHLSSSSRPTYLQPGQAKNEVQEIKVTATSGDVFVIEPVSLEELQEGKIEFGELKHTEFVYNATHEEARSALEALYGIGNVEVTGGPQGKPSVVTELEPYVVAFKGAL